MIISLTGSPLHNLANSIHEILSLSFPISFSHIHNSLDFLKKFANLDVVLISLDVVSLFTNVPVDLVLEILEEKWSYIYEHTRLPKNEFILPTKFILQSTFLYFNITNITNRLLELPWVLHFLQ